MGRIQHKAKNSQFVFCFESSAWTIDTIRAKQYYYQFICFILLLLKLYIENFHFRHGTNSVSFSIDHAIAIATLQLLRTRIEHFFFLMNRKLS